MTHLDRTTRMPFMKSHLLAMLAFAATVFIFTGCSEEPLTAPPAIDQQQASAAITGPVSAEVGDADKLTVIPVTTRNRYLKDTNLSGAVTPQLDLNGDIVGWDVAISGSHFQSPVNYNGAIVGGLFAPALPGLGWLADGAELLPAYEDAFVSFSNDPYALTHLGEGGGTIDAPLSNSSWGKLLALGPDKLNPSDFMPGDFDRSVFDRDESALVTKFSYLHVIVHDPATGKPLSDKEAAVLLENRGLAVDRVDAFLRGEATAKEIASMADKDGVQVTVGAEVSIEVSVPPFVSITVTGSVSLTGDLEDYEELAAKAEELASDLAEKLAARAEEGLKDLKKILKRIISEIEGWIDSIDWWPLW